MEVRLLWPKVYENTTGVFIKLIGTASEACHLQASVYHHMGAGGRFESKNL